MNVSKSENRRRMCLPGREVFLSVSDMQANGCSGPECFLSVLFNVLYNVGFGPESSNSLRRANERVPVSVSLSRRHVSRILSNDKSYCTRSDDSCGCLYPTRFEHRSVVIWLILPVVICLSQRLSHACLSTN